MFFRFHSACAFHFRLSPIAFTPIPKSIENRVVFEVSVFTGIEKYFAALGAGFHPDMGLHRIRDFIHFHIT